MTAPTRDTETEFEPVYHRYGPHRAGLPPLIPYFRELWHRRGFAAEMSRARALGQQSWQEALAANDFSRFRDALAQQFELRHRYVACFDDAAHPSVAVTDEVYSIRDFVTAFPATQDGFVQLRLYLGTPAAGTLTQAAYDTADLRVDGDRWQLVRGGSAPC